MEILKEEITKRLAAEFDKVELYEDKFYGFNYIIVHNGNTYTSNTIIPSNYKDVTYDYLGQLIEEIKAQLDKLT